MEDGDEKRSRLTGNRCARMSQIFSSAGILIPGEELGGGDAMNGRLVSVVERKLVTEPPQEHAHPQSHQKNGEADGGRLSFQSFDHGVFDGALN